MVNLKDVALRAGVSLTQASRALNGREDVSEATRKKVEKAAVELGYVKNMAASALAGSIPLQIAALVKGIEQESTDFGSPNIHSLLSGISSYASSHSLEAATYLLDDSCTSYAGYCRQRGVRGAILFGADYQSGNYREMVESELCCVVIDIPLEAERKGCVLVNDFYYAKQAACALIESGCRQVFMLSGHPRAYVSQTREAGFRAALAEAGLPCLPEQIINADFDWKEARQATLELLKRCPETDGIFCASDYMALGCHSALQHLKKKIPEEVSLFGFDGLVSTQMVHPTIATVRQDSFRKGYRAAALLHKLLLGEACDHTVTVPCQMIPGGSVKKTDAGR